MGKTLSLAHGRGGTGKYNGPKHKKGPRVNKHFDDRFHKEDTRIGLDRPGIDKEKVRLLAQLLKNSAVIAKKRGLKLLKGPKVTGHTGPATVESIQSQLKEQQALFESAAI